MTIRFTRLAAAAVAAFACSASALAAITADEAKALGTTLTPIGAEVAANKDGTIPAYTGGVTQAPAGFKAGDGIRPNPFAGEKPRLTIDAKNSAQYGAQLTEGTKALLQKYPTFHVDVYPTHRSVAFPKWVADNTGFEVQIDELARGSDEEREEHRTGAIYDIPVGVGLGQQQYEHRAALSPGVWHQLEILVRDNTYQVTLDGTPTTAFTNTDPLRGQPARADTACGYIGAQSFLGHVAFRSVRIKTT